MRPLPVLSPAVSSKIAKPCCIRFDLKHRQVKPLAGQGRAGQEVAKPIGVVQGPDIELDIKTTKDNSAINLSIFFLLRRGTG